MGRPILYIFIYLTLFLSSKVYGQQWEFGANVAGTGYMGDINPSDPLYYNNMSGGLSVKYNFDPTWGIRVNTNYLRIGGADRDFNNERQTIRNLSFTNNIWEVSAVGKFHFFRFVPSYDRFSFTPYLYAGIAAIHHSPYVTIQNEKVHLMELMIDQEGYDTYESPNKWAVSVPYGFGLKYNLKGPWSIGAEIGYRTAFTNKLDNVSGYYAPTSLTYQEVIAHNPDTQRYPGLDDATWQHLADPSGQLDVNQGRLRGSGGKYDGYMTAGLTITYSIVSTRCYWW